MNGPRTVYCPRCFRNYDIKLHSTACPHKLAVTPALENPLMLPETPIKWELKLPPSPPRMHRNDLRALMFASLASPIIARDEPITTHQVETIKAVVDSILEDVEETSVQPAPEQDVVGFIADKNAAHLCEELDTHLFEYASFRNGPASTRLLEYLERWKREALNIQASLDSR